MPLYERRTYQVRVGQMPELTALYREKAWPVIQAAGLAKHCVGYFITDTGALHQLVHIWRFEDDAERRNFWEKLLGIDAFPLVEIRSLLVSQENQLMRGADWGPVV
ncbi:NIPSNAP superfamily [Ruegeria sp. ANG-S4]|uniref:NIPSNAP family protein n=1 Tax=Ruegeria sp. ANG-S4 TaxID=1577904 RepID=UPI000580A559|nr:NIPSNAP family protein [Ruegeria sp. ANG-S4]KIC47619.1 NIPSNAP superfamily [Ruegeria sp. ANG-S4]